MKQTWKQAGRGILAVIIAAAALAVFRVTAGALPYEDALRGSKSVSAVDGEERSFRMDYQVWTVETAEEAVEPCDVLLLLDTSALMGEGPGDRKDGSYLDRALDGAAGFIREMAEVSPESRAGVVLFSGEAEAWGPEKLEEKGAEDLTAALAGRKAAGSPDYAGALQKALELTEKLGDREDRPLYVITVASGLWGEETTEVLEPLLKLREQGARCYTVLLCPSLGEETEEFWQEMSSAPVAGYHYVCNGEAARCLGAIRKKIASGFLAEVRQRLDPRFTLGEEEQARLRREGAHVAQERDGSWTVSWEADLPRPKETPWTASLTVRAREEFPGGNHIPLDGEGTGLYRFGKETGILTRSFVNVPLRLKFSDLTAQMFLGERVKTWAGEGSVEDAMRAGPRPAWFGKGQTGVFTYFWETEEGDPIGTLEQLGALRPEQDVDYVLRVGFQPGNAGLLAAGEPVVETEVTARYRLEVVAGTVKITVTTGTETSLGPGTALTFRLERGDGKTFLCTARMESDPQTGRVLLTGEASGLPYGAYEVSPIAQEGLICWEESQLCMIGVCGENDTVSPDRNWAQARFALAAPGGGQDAGRAA